MRTPCLRNSPAGGFTSKVPNRKAMGGSISRHFISASEHQTTLAALTQLRFTLRGAILAKDDLLTDRHSLPIFPNQLLERLPSIGTARLSSSMCESTISATRQKKQEVYPERICKGAKIASNNGRLLDRSHRRGPSPSCQPDG